MSVNLGFKRTFQYFQALYSVVRISSQLFADSMNDLSMFQYAKHTIAMGNHAKGLDPFTEYVTAEVEKDGIAQAIRHYGLD